jgi:hypothetical protein
MWHGVKMIAAIISGIDTIIMPLNRKITDGSIESANALNILLL